MKTYRYCIFTILLAVLLVGLQATAFPARASLNLALLNEGLTAEQVELVVAGLLNNILAAQSRLLQLRVRRNLVCFSCELGAMALDFFTPELSVGWFWFSIYFFTISSGAPPQETTQ